jgi:hypothetical protein
LDLHRSLLQVCKDRYDSYANGLLGFDPSSLSRHVFRIIATTDGLSVLLIKTTGASYVAPDGDAAPLSSKYE